MRDPARIDRIIAKLRAYWHASPDLRLAQIVGNAVGKPGDHYHVEDDVIEAGIPSRPDPAPLVLTPADREALRWARRSIAGSTMPTDDYARVAAVLDRLLDLPARGGEVIPSPESRPVRTAAGGRFSIDSGEVGRMRERVGNTYDIISAAGRERAAIVLRAVVKSLALHECHDPSHQTCDPGPATPPAGESMTEALVNCEDATVEAIAQWLDGLAESTPGQKWSGEMRWHAAGYRGIAAEIRSGTWRKP